MGDEVLKRIRAVFIFTCIAISSHANSISLQDKTKVFDTIFESINKKRIGLTDKEISETKNPFIVETNTTNQDDQTKRREKKTYRLEAILVDRAKINDNWHRLKDKIGVYVLVQIKDNSVILDNLGEKLELFLYRGSKSVKISTKQ